MTFISKEKALNSLRSMVELSNSDRVRAIAQISRLAPDDPIVRGYWVAEISKDNDIGWVKYCCSRCGFEKFGSLMWFKWNYCPNCGARLSQEIEFTED